MKTYNIIYQHVVVVCDGHCDHIKSVKTLFLTNKFECKRHKLFRESYDLQIVMDKFLEQSKLNM